MDQPTEWKTYYDNVFKWGIKIVPTYKSVPCSKTILSSNTTHYEEKKQKHLKIYRDVISSSFCDNAFDILLYGLGVGSPSLLTPCPA